MNVAREELKEESSFSNVPCVFNDLNK